MLRSERVTTDACGLSRRWIIHPQLAGMLVRTEQWLAQIFAAEGLRWPGLFVVSGWRSASTQAQVNPANPTSKHRWCPSVAADLRIGDLPASTTPRELWAIVGTLWKAQGGRWGGDFRDPDDNHFEMLTV